jgi:hypothetical protein
LIATIPGGPRFGIWLMPENQNDGGIEAFLEPMVPKDALWDFAGDATDHSKSHGAKWKDCHRSKARLHALLAWGEEPGRPYGNAIKCGDLDARKNPVAEAFVTWFEGVFGE